MTSPLRLSSMFVDEQKDQNALFHKAIKNGNCDKVQELISTGKLSKLAYYNDLSACCIAIQSNQLKIYEILIINGFSLHPEEILIKITSNSETLRKVHEINLKFVKFREDRHLQIIWLNSTLSPSSDNINLCFDKITEALKYLDTSELIRPMLEVVAFSGSFKIIFCFESAAIHLTDPTKARFVHGVFYPKDKLIFIGAKGLIEKNGDVNKYQAYGTLAHELCHYAMEILYKNNAKPYTEEDFFRKEEYIEVVEECRRLRYHEEIIGRVFTGVYDEDKIHAEIIVRVPHIVGVKIEKSQVFCSIEKKFKKLFDFYRNHTLPDILARIDKIKEKTEIEELNELFGVKQEFKLHKDKFQAREILNISISSEKPVNVVSNCSLMTLLSFHDNSKLGEVSQFSIIYATSIDLEKGFLFKKLINSMKSCLKPTVIVDCGNQSPEKVCQLSVKLKENKIDQNVIFITKRQVWESDLNINHNWSDFTKNAQQKIKNELQLNLQGIDIKFCEIFKNEVEELLTTAPLQSLLERKIYITEERKIEKEVRNYITRALKVKNNDNGFFLRNNFEGNSKKVKRSKNFLNDDTKFPLENELLLNPIKYNVLLSDKPGMGKSTEFVSFFQKFKLAYPKHWIVYIDLKEHIGCFKKPKSVLQERSRVGNFLGLELLKAGDFEAKLFVEFFNNDKVVLLFDGFDEISPTHKGFVKELLVSIESLTRNCLWISTRPHFEEELLDSIQSLIPIELVEFSRENQEEFVVNSLREKNFEEAQVEVAMEEILRICESPSNPLMLYLVTEVLGQSIKSDLISTLETLNSFSVHDKFVDIMRMKMIKHKGSEGQSSAEIQLRTDKFMKFHYILAFEAFSLENAKQIIFPTGLQHESLTVDHLARNGLVYQSVNSNFHFTHQTLAEYFMANFLIEKLFGLEFRSEEELDNLVLVFLVITFDFEKTKIVKMIDEGFRCDVATTNESRLKLSVLAQKLCYSRFSKSSLIGYLFRLESMKLAEFIFKALEIEKRDQFRENLAGIFRLCAIRFSHSGLENLKKFWSLAESLFGSSFIKDFWISSHIEIVQAISRNKDSRVTRFILDDFEKTFPTVELLQLLFAVGKASLECSNVDSLDMILRFLEKHLGLDECSSQIKSSGVVNKIIPRILKELKYEESHFEKLFELMHRYLSEHLNKLCFKGMKTFLKEMSIGKKFQSQTLRVFLEFITKYFERNKLIEWLVRRDQNNRTLLHDAVLTRNLEVFRTFKNYYSEIFSEKEIVEIFEQDSIGSLSELLFQGKSFHTIKSFWGDLLRWLDEEKLGKILKITFSLRNLSIAESCKNIWNYSEIETIFIPFILDRLTDDELDEINFFELYLRLLKLVSKTKLNELFPKTNQRLSNFLAVHQISTNNQLLMLTNTMSNSDPEIFHDFFQTLFKNSSFSFVETFSFLNILQIRSNLLEIIKKFELNENLRALLKLLASKEIHPKRLSLETSTPGDLKITFRMLEKYLNFQEILQILVMKDEHKISLLKIAVLTADTEFFRVVWSFYEKFLDLNEQKAFLIEVLLFSNNLETFRLVFKLILHKFGRLGLHEVLDYAFINSLKKSDDDKIEIFRYWSLLDEIFKHESIKDLLPDEVHQKYLVLQQVYQSFQYHQQNENFSLVKCQIEFRKTNRKFLANFLKQTLDLINFEPENVCNLLQILAELEKENVAKLFEQLEKSDLVRNILRVSEKSHISKLFRRLYREKNSSTIKIILSGLKSSLAKVEFADFLEEIRIEVFDFIFSCEPKDETQSFNNGLEMLEIIQEIIPIEISELVQQADEDGFTVLHYLALQNKIVDDELKSFEVFRKVLGEKYFLELCMKRNKSHQNVLTLVLRNKNFECFECLWKECSEQFDPDEIKELLLHRDIDGLTLLHQTFKSSKNSCEKYKFLKQIYQDQLEAEDFVKFLLSQDCQGENFLFHVVRNSSLPGIAEIFVEMWEDIAQNYDQDHKRLSFILLKTNKCEKKLLQTVKFTQDFKSLLIILPIIFISEELSQDFFDFLFRVHDFDILVEFFSACESFPDIKKSFFQHVTSSNRRNIFHVAFMKLPTAEITDCAQPVRSSDFDPQNCETSLFLLQKAVETLDHFELLNLLSKEDKIGRSCFFYAFMNDINFANFFLEKKFLEEIKLREVLNSQDENGWSLLHHSCVRSQLHAVNDLLDYLEKFLSPLDRAMLVEKKTKSGVTVTELFIKNESFETVNSLERVKILRRLMQMSPKAETDSKLLTNYDLLVFCTPIEVTFGCSNVLLTLEDIEKFPKVTISDNSLNAKLRQFFFQSDSDLKNNEKEKKSCFLNFNIVDKNGENLLFHALKEQNGIKKFQNIIKMLENKIRREEIRSMLMQSNRKAENLLHFAEICRKVEFDEEFYEIFDGFLNSRELRDLISQVTDSGENLFMIASSKPIEIEDNAVHDGDFQRFWQFIKKKLDLADRKALICHTDKNNKSVLNYSSLENFEFVLKKISKFLPIEINSLDNESLHKFLFPFISSEQSDERDILHRNLREKLDKHFAKLFTESHLLDLLQNRDLLNPRFLKATKENYYSFFHFLNFFMRKFREDFKKNEKLWIRVIATNFQYCTMFFSMSVSLLDISLLRKLLEFSDPENSWTLLHYAAKNKHFQIILSHMTRYLHSHDWSKLTMAKNCDGDNFLFVYKKASNCYKILYYLEKCLNAKKFKLLLKSTNKSRNNLMNLSVSDQSICCLWDFLEIIRTKLSFSEVKQMLTTKTTDQNNALMIFAYLSDDFKDFWAFFENFFNSQKKREILKQEDSEDCTVLHIVVKTQNKLSLDFTMNLYEQFFSDIELQEILRKYDDFGENLLDSALNHIMLAEYLENKIS